MNLSDVFEGLRQPHPDLLLVGLVHVLEQVSVHRLIAARHSQRVINVDIFKL